MDSLDKATLSIIIPEDKLESNPVFFLREGAAVECFIHSDGEIAEFYFSYGTEVGYYTDDRTQVPLDWGPIPVKAADVNESLAGSTDAGETEEPSVPEDTVEQGEADETDTIDGSSLAGKNYTGPVVLMSALMLGIIGCIIWLKKRSNKAN